jgi:Tfp pilus assembly protein PilF
VLLPNVKMTLDQALQLARQHHGVRRLREAEAIYRQILAVDPNHAETLNLLGLIALQCGQAGPAIELMERSIARDAGVFFYFNNLAEAYKRAGRYADAAGAFERSLALRPDDPETMHSRAVALERAGEVERAIEELRRTLTLAPNLATAHLSLGAILEQRAEYDEALAHFERAAAARPDYARAHAGRAGIWLRDGNYARGWEEYEWRWRVEGFPGRPPRPGVPVWDGAPLDGRTILLTAEQGLGDTIQFIRYAPLVAARCGRVVVECPASLVRLVRSVEGVADAVPSADAIPIDVQIPLLSLPRVFGTRADSIPASVPYIRVLGDAWNERVTDDGRLKVGLCWAGGRSQPHRTIPSTGVEKLLSAFPEVRFYSLQKDVPDDDPHRPAGMVDLMSEVSDFADTAGMIGRLDLVISIDTSVAHLAGAMGKPTWVALARHADWRWFRDRGESPWYPTMTLFRQPAAGDWGAVLDAITSHLRQHLTSRAQV